MLIIVGSVLVVHIEHKRISVIHVFTTTIPVLRCVASALCSFSRLDDDEGWPFIEDLLLEYIKSPTISRSSVDAGQSKLSFAFGEVAHNFLHLITGNNF